MARILIIDDEQQIRSMLRLMLERDGYEVVEAPDGIEGIRAYRQNPADSGQAIPWRTGFTAADGRWRPQVV